MSQTLGPTIAIDLDMLQTARERAETRGESLGKVVLDMMRKSLALRAPVPEYRNGIKRLPWRNFTRMVSVEDVNVLLNEPERSGFCHQQVGANGVTEMRTTLTIPDDVLLAARQRAEARGITIGEALGELARRGLDFELEECQDGFWKGVKFLPRRPGEPRITTELVNKLRDELP